MQTVSGRVGSRFRGRRWAGLRRTAEEHDDVPNDVPEDVPSDLPEGPANGPADAQEPLVVDDDVAVPLPGTTVRPDRISRRILLVEDDPGTQDVYRRILLYGGFDVLVAENGQDAVRLARDELPDLILMDINLPILSGWEAAAILKGDGETSRIPIVAISANIAEANHARASDLGFEAYFTKPFPPTMVLEAVQRLFGMMDES